MKNYISDTLSELELSIESSANYSAKLFINELIYYIEQDKEKNTKEFLTADGFFQLAKCIKESAKIVSPATADNIQIDN